MSTDSTYDLVILGGGAAAFAAITEADRRGLSTAIVNTGLPLGGTCVNVGCVPSKHLLEVGKTAFEPPTNPFDAVDYADGQPAVDWEAAIDEQADVVADLREQNYVDVVEHFDTDLYEGRGRFVDDRGATGDEPTIEIAEGLDAGTRVTGDYALIATGSSPWIAPIDGIEDVDYETSESILARRDRPESVVVLGGGYVAVEWGQILHRLGVDVTILQRSSHVLSSMWSELGRDLQSHLREEGIDLVTDVSFTRVSEAGDEIAVEASVDDEERTFTATDVFVATGVEPNVTDLGLEAIGAETDSSGAIAVDETYRTDNRVVFAAGDCIGEPMLETVAAKEGNLVVKNAFDDERNTIDYDAVPKVVYTSPEVASVGVTEPEYMDEHGTCSCRTVELDNLSKAKAVEDTRGLVQVVRHHETDAVVGVHMVGPRAADMIPEATLAVKFGLTVDDVIDTVHPFPTFSEAFKQACQAFRRDVSRMTCCVE